MPLKKLQLPEDSSSTKKVLIYLFTAYFFAVATRAALYFQTADISAFWLNGQPLPIWSPDAGLYGYYAKQILGGHTYPFVSEYMPGYVIAGVVKLSGFSIDSIMFWLPAVLSSLIVLPVLMAAHAYRQDTLGLIAALLAATSANFYTRSHLGYMDTDVLNVFFPWMAIAYWIYALKHNSIFYAVLAAIMLGLFRLWYHSSDAIIFGLFFGLLVTGILFFRKQNVAYQTIILAAPMLLPIPFWASLSSVIATGFLFGFLEKRLAITPKHYLFLLLAAAVAIPFIINLTSYIERAQDYFSKSDMLAIATSHGVFHFQDSLSSVIEAKGAPIWQVSPVFKGLLAYIFPAIIGFFLLAAAYRAFAIAAVLLILGFLSPIVGIRFTIYATPALALGFAYLLILLMHHFFIQQRIRQLFTAAVSMAALLLMGMNIALFNPHLQPFYFHKNEVKALEDFSMQADNNDLILSWWDYGWPIWYYTGKNITLVDNGLNHSDTFYVGNMLLSSNPTFVAHSAAYARKIRNSGVKEVIPYIARHGDVFEQFKLLSNPQNSVEAPGNSYILLHRDMLAVLPTIAATADRDPRSGNPTRHRQFYLSELQKPYDGKDPILHGDTFTLDLRSGIITGSNGASSRVSGVAVSENGKLTAAQRFDANAPMYLIIYNRTKALYMDKSVFNSFLIQALVLGVYNKTYFEPVAETGIMKLFKVR